MYALVVAAFPRHEQHAWKTLVSAPDSAKDNGTNEMSYYLLVQCKNKQNASFYILECNRH